MAYTWFLRKLFSLFILISSFTFAQKPTESFSVDNLDSTYFAKLKAEYGNNKILPSGFEKQVLIALSYFPELKNIKIIFRVKVTKTPLSARPRASDMLINAKKRTYIITISKKSTSFLNEIILENLNFNAQVGVLGHELSHIADFVTQNFWGMSGIIIKQISKKYTDHFEYQTDQRCIDHGLGYQLLAWSINVRDNLKIKLWQGANNPPPKNKKERYMNPSTITEILKSHPLYKKE